MRTIITLDFTNHTVVSGRSNSLRKHGNPELRFTDANVVALRQGPQNYESGLGFYKEPQLDHLTRIVFTVFDTVQNYPIAELEVELEKKQMRWIKPMTFYRILPFELDLELIQDPTIPTHLPSIAI